jgi:putative transposase
VHNGTHIRYTDSVPYRHTPIVTGEFYHVFNRGVARLPTFLDAHDYRAALLGLQFYQAIEPPMRLSFYKRLARDERNQVLERLGEARKLVRIVAFSLMPNHFHLLVQPLVDDGVSTFCRRWLNSYGRYFNVRHDRTGALFQEMFKARRISSTEQLLHVSRYVHINPPVSGVIREDKLLTYPWTSLPEYLGVARICDPEPILEHFKDPTAYVAFLQDRIDYGRSLERIKHLVDE